MKHNAKLNDPKIDRARVNITFLDANGKARRIDDIYLTTAEGELLVKKLNSGIAIK